MGGCGQTVAEEQERGGKTFWNFCFEMVHFGAKVTNAVLQHQFCGKTRLKA